MSEQNHQCRCAAGSPLVLDEYSFRCECVQASCGSSAPCHLFVGPQVVCAVSNSRRVMESKNQGSDVSDLAPSEPAPPPHGLLGRRHSVDSNIGRTRPPTFIRTYREVKWKRVNHSGRLLPRSAQLDPPAAPGVTEAESREYIDGTHIIRQRVPIFMTSCDPQGELGRRFSAGDLVPVTGLSQNWTSYGKCLFIRNSPPNDGSMTLHPHTSSNSYACSLSASDKKRLDPAHDDDDHGFLMIDEDDEDDFTDDGSEEEDDDEMRDKSSSNRDSGVCVCDYIDKLSTSCPTPASTILLDKPPSVPPARHSDTALKTLPTDPGDLSRYVHGAGESWPLLSEQEDARSLAYSQAVGSTSTRLHVPWVATETAVSSVASTQSDTQDTGKAVSIFAGFSATSVESVFSDGEGRPVLTQTISGVSSPLSSESIFTDGAGRPGFDEALPGVSSPTSALSVFTNGTGKHVLAPATSSVLSPLSTKYFFTNGSSRPILAPAMSGVSSPTSAQSIFTNGASMPVMAPIRSKTDVVVVGNGSVMVPATSQPSTKPVLSKPGVMHPNTQPASHEVATSPHVRATAVSSQKISRPCALHRTNSDRPELPRHFLGNRSWVLASSRIAGTSVYVCTCRPLSSKTNGMSAQAVTRPVPVNLEEAIATRVELVKISSTREGEPLLFQKVTYSSGSICCSTHWVAPTKVSTGSDVSTGRLGVRQTGVPSSVHRPAAARTDLPAADVSDGSFAVGKVGAAQQPFLIISDLSRDVSLTLAAATTKGKCIVVKVTKDNVGVEEASQIMSASDTATSRFPVVGKVSNGCMNDENYGASSNFSTKSSVNTQPEQETACQRERTQSQMVDKQVLPTSLSCDKCVMQDKSIVNEGTHPIPQTTGTRNDESDSCTGLGHKAILRGVSEPRLMTSATESDCVYRTARPSSTFTTNQAPAARLSPLDDILEGTPPGSRTDHESASMPLNGIVGMQRGTDPQPQTDNTVKGSEIYHDLIREKNLTNLLESNVKSKDCFTFTVTSTDLSSHASLDVEDQSSLSSRDLDKLSPPGEISYIYPNFHVRLNDTDASRHDSNTRISSIKDVEVVENVDEGLFTEDGDLLPALIKDISEIENVQESSERQAQGGGGSTVAIDNKIEQAMDLVKRHLMYAVREEVEILKQQIGEMMERIGQLEYENTVLRSEARPETLSKLLQPRVNSAPVTAAPQQPPSSSSSSQQPAVSSQTAATPVSAAPAPQSTQTQPSSQPPPQQQQQHLQQPSVSQVPPPSASSS